MSPRIAWALIELAAGKRPDWLHSDEGSRLRARYRRLADDAEPEVLVRSWLAARAERHVLAGTELDTLRGDSRLVLAGVSDPRSGMSAQSTVEAYVHQDAFDGLCADHLLVPAPRRQGNVILHVAPVLPSDPPPLLLLVADLAEHDSPRELDRARELLKTAQENL